MCCNPSTYCKVSLDRSVVLIPEKHGIGSREMSGKEKLLQHTKQKRFVTKRE